MGELARPQNPGGLGKTVVGRTAFEGNCRKGGIEGTKRCLLVDGTWAAVTKKKTRCGEGWESNGNRQNVSSLRLSVRRRGGIEEKS